MSRLLWCSILLLPAALLRGQASGVSTEWDARKMLEALTLQTQHFQSVIARVKTDSWVANGAPQTYVAQWTTAQNEMNYLLGSIDALSKQPERLPLALDAYFRMQAMESTFGSVIEGIRKYQNPAMRTFCKGSSMRTAPTATSSASLSPTWQRRKNRNSRWSIKRRSVAGECS